MKHYNVRGRLIDSTIAVIAAEGLDKTTTKAIAKGVDINEAYIYRCFSDKEQLLAQTFDSLDKELLETAQECLPIMFRKGMGFAMQCRLFFSAVWRFLLGNREKCLAFVRYYYSPYFSKNSQDAHTQRYQHFLEIFRGAFREEANVWMLLNHILNVMLDFAVKVFSGAVSDSENTEEHVFRLVYCSVRPYFKPEMECGKPYEKGVACH